MSMNGNTELLNFVYQNSEMGVDTINQLTKIADDKDFKLHLQAQFDGYVKTHNAARKLLNENGFDEKGISGIDKIKTYMMINLQTLTDNSASHIAEMLIIGSSMGIIEAVKKLHQYSNANSDILDLMSDLQRFEERNIEKLKEFL